MAAIKSNPKSYAAWYHRRWLAAELKAKDPLLSASHELQLCNKLLELDPRNCTPLSLEPRRLTTKTVHCWNYRWYLTESFAVPVQSEFDYTTLMIYRNFSNYSAWHRRSLLFPRLEAVIGGEALEQCTLAGTHAQDQWPLTLPDLKLVKSAYFTEPADQSCWFYLRWLLDFVAGRFGGREGLLRGELASVSELLAIEPNAPLALNMWLYLAGQLGICDEAAGEKLARLRRVDPLRAGMYAQMGRGGPAEQ